MTDMQMLQMYQQENSGFNGIQQQDDHSNPFEMIGDADDYAENINKEMLDVHNRSTQQDPGVQLPARKIDNGMANQIKVQTMNDKHAEKQKP